jgi:hypothetical protein
LSTAVYHRVPLLFGFAFLAISLAVLYSIGVVLPGPVGAGIWVVTAVICFAAFRAHRVHLLTLTCASVVFYLYICVALLWPVLFPNLFIAVHSTAFQTPEIFAKANHLAATGLAALAAGWLAGFEVVEWRARPARARVPYPVRAGSFVVSLLLAVPLAVLAFPTETIFTVGYNGAAKDQTVGAALGINVLKPSVIICALIALMALLQRPTKIRWVVWITLLGVVVLVLGFASGDRVEEVGCLLAVGWLVLSARPVRRTPRTWIVCGIVSGVFLLFLGEVRNTFPSQPLDASLLWSAAKRSLEVFPSGESTQVKPSTNGDAALTFCVVIGLVDTGVLRIDHGETFLNYLDMTLPRFMNADRPEELQVLLQRLSMTGGGLYILAEPYLAGGAAGIVVVLGLFGLGIGALEAVYLRRSFGKMTFFFYALLLSCVPRWFLYSILSMYKHVLTGLLLLGVVKVLSSLFERSGSTLVLSPLSVRLQQ